MPFETRYRNMGTGGAGPRERSRARTLIIAVGLILAGCAMGLFLRNGSLFSPSDARFPKGPLIETPPDFASVFGAQAGMKSGGKATLADVAARVQPAVVSVYSERIVPGRLSWMDMLLGNRSPRGRRMQSLGSGVLVSTDGVLLTNNHVIEGADAIQVQLADNRQFSARVVGADPGADLAVLRLVDAGTDLPALPIGDSSRLRVGDAVLAVGNPFGIGQTVTFGIVSAVGRSGVGVSEYEAFIQTDAAINPGNSGGALVNMSGELVGINTAIMSRSGGYQGIGFAIPGNLAKSIMTDILDNGSVRRGYLGVRSATLTETLRRHFKIKGVKRGVLVLGVVEDSPADKAGIQRGDVVVSVGGAAVASDEDLRNRIGLNPAGSEVPFNIVRDGKRLTRRVRLAARPPGMR